MTTAHGDVVEKNVAVEMTPRRGDWPIKQESRTGVRATLNNQQRRPAGQTFDGFRLGGSRRTAIRLVKEVVAKICGGLSRRFSEVSVVVAVHVFPPPATSARFAWCQPTAWLLI